MMMESTVILIPLASAFGGALIGAWLQSRWSGQSQRRERRRQIFREVLFAATQIQFTAEFIARGPWWQRWLPWPSPWLLHTYVQLLAAGNLAIWAYAGLALEEDTDQERQQLAKLIDLQDQAIHGMFRPGADRMQYATSIMDGVITLRDTLVHDLDELDSPWWKTLMQLKKLH